METFFPFFQFKVVPTDFKASASYFNCIFEIAKRFQVHSAQNLKKKSCEPNFWLLALCAWIGYGTHKTPKYPIVNVINPI